MSVVASNRFRADDEKTVLRAFLDRAHEREHYGVLLSFES